MRAALLFTPLLAVSVVTVAAAGGGTERAVENGPRPASEAIVAERVAASPALTPTLANRILGPGPVLTVPPPAIEQTALTVTVESAPPGAVPLAPLAPSPQGSATVPSNTDQSTADLSTTGSSWDARRAQLEAGVDGAPSLGVADEVTHHVGIGLAYPTISLAVAAAEAGDVIVVHEQGSPYRESFTSSSGWLGTRLHFRAAPGERPIVSGADVVSGWEPVGDQWVHSYDGDRFEFALPVSGNILPEQIGDSAMAGYLEQLFVDGQPARQLSSRDAVDSPGEFFVDRDADQIWLGSSPQGHLIEVSARDRALVISEAASGSSVSGFEITGFSPQHLDGRGSVVVERAHDVVIRDTAISHSAATGLVAAGGLVRGLHLERVSLVDNAGRGLAADQVEGMRIEFSRVDRNNRAGFDADECGGGEYCVVAGAKLTRAIDTTVRYSSFSQNDATGFWCDIDCRGLVFVGNHVAENARHGAYFEVSEDAQIVSNLFVDNAEAGLKSSGSRSVDVVRNTFVANGAQVNIGSDFRPGTIGFHTRVESHMGGIDLVDNVFAEVDTVVPVVDPVDIDGLPVPSTRLGDVSGNVYLLLESTGSAWRFRTDGGRFLTEPDHFSSLVGMVVVDPSPQSSFRDAPGGDYRLLIDPRGEGEPRAVPSGAASELIGAVPAGSGAILSSS